METKSFDFIITGAGPAGLTAAMYAARNGLLTLTIDSSFAGGQATQIYNLENYPGIFPAVNGFDFADTLRKQAESFGAKIIQAHPSSVLLQLPHQKTYTKHPVFLLQPELNIKKPA